MQCMSKSFQTIVTPYAVENSQQRGILGILESLPECKSHWLLEILLLGVNPSPVSEGNPPPTPDVALEVIFLSRNDSLLYIKKFPQE